jgi:cytochrome c-type biogenesis protein
LEAENVSFDLSGFIFVFTSGILTLFSPCGFPMLPGYISYYMGTTSSLEKAIPSGIACALGLITVFSVIGAISSLFGSVVNPYIPLFELVAGVVIIFLGVGMLAEPRFLSFFLPLKAPKRKGIFGIFLYGVVYGLAALSCSAPIFFAVLFWAITSGGFISGIVTFMVYAAGMGGPLILITVLVALAKEATLSKIAEITLLVQKIGGIILIIVGIYLIYFYYSLHGLSSSF